MITVRNAAIEDAELILEIYDYYVKNTAITFEYDTPSLDEFKGRMEKTMQCYPYLAILRDGYIEGYAYAAAFVGRAAYNWSCETTVWMEKIIGEHKTKHPAITIYPKLKARKDCKVKR